LGSLEIRGQPPEQPHHLEIARALALQTTARLDAVEIAVDVELEMHRGVIPRAADADRIDRLKAQIVQIERLNEGVDHTNRIVFVDPIIEASRQQ